MKAAVAVAVGKAQDQSQTSGTILKSSSSKKPPQKLNMIHARECAPKILSSGRATFPVRRPRKAERSCSCRRVARLWSGLKLNSCLWSVVRQRAYCHLKKIQLQYCFAKVFMLLDLLQKKLHCFLSFIVICVCVLGFFIVQNKIVDTCKVEGTCDMIFSKF